MLGEEKRSLPVGGGAGPAAAAGSPARPTARASSPFHKKQTNAMNQILHAMQAEVEVQQRQLKRDLRHRAYARQDFAEPLSQI